MHQIRDLEVAKVMYRANTNILPSPLQDMLCRNRRGNFPVRYSTNERMMKNISHAGPRIWQNLTNECKEAVTKTDFRNKVKALLLNRWVQIYPAHPSWNNYAVVPVFVNLINTWLTPKLQIVGVLCWLVGVASLDLCYTLDLDPALSKWLCHGYSHHLTFILFYYFILFYLT